jgi:hypothetical protein
MDVFSAVTTAYTSVKKIVEASRTLQNAEMKQMIADLAMQLADACLQMAELKHEMLRLQGENDALKTAKVSNRPNIVKACYQFEGDEGLYCPVCYDTKGKKDPHLQFCIFPHVQCV